MTLQLSDFLANCDLGFSLELGNGKDPVTTVTADEMRSKTITRDGSSTLVVWQGHPRCGETFAVTATWQETPDGRFEGRLAYTGFDGDLFIEAIHFPLVKVPVDDQSKMLDGGFLIPVKLLSVGSARNNQIRQVECAAVINSSLDSCYMDWRDPSWSVKFLSFKRVAEDTVAFSGKYLMPLTGEKQPAGAIPYPCSVAFYRGGWFDVVGYYKPWGTAQRWWTNQQNPNPLADIGLWVWNRGLAADVIPPVEKLQQDLGPDIRVALDWYWWHHNPYDTDYPNFWPPREGIETFKQNVKRLTDQHIYCQVYINGVCWDHDTFNWAEGGDDGVHMRRDGSIKEYDFNKYNHHRLAWMCGVASVFQDKLAALVRELHGSGLTGQYMDMIGCATFEPCYNPNHDHPKGGGSYQIDGFRRMLTRITGENRGYPITSETTSEPYMDLVSGGIICSEASSERMGRPFEYVPLFMAVYHGRFAAFGNYAIPDGIPPWDPLWPSEDRWKEEKDWHHLYPEMFFIEMARPVIWGAQPMVCSLRPHIYSTPEFAEEYAFTLETARFYWRNRDFLYHGTMLSPEGFSCGEHDVEFFYRFIFSKPDTCKVITRTIPNVIHSCWQNPAGQRALFLANYTPQEQSWTFHDKSGVIPPHSYAKVDL